MKAKELMTTLERLFAIKRTTYIQGSPGGGKTTIVRDVAKKLGVEYVEVHMPTMLVEDMGIPMPQPDGTIKYVLPEWIPVEGSKHDQQVIVCLDDFGQASHDIQKVVANMVQSGIHHGKKLKDIMFIMTGNKQSDRSGVVSMLRHLGNRMTIVELDTNISNWLDWSSENGVHSLVQGFVQFRPDLLHMFNPQKEQSPTPRSWVEGVSAIMELWGNDYMKDGSVDITLQECIMGAVGEGAGAEFVGFLQTYADLPKPEEILKSPSTALIPEKPDVMCALCASIGTIANEYAENFIKYLDRLFDNDKAEYSILALKMVQSKHGIEPFVAVGKPYAELMVKNAKFTQAGR